MGHISKRTHKECSLHCRCFCSRAHGKRNKGYKSRNVISLRYRGNKQDTVLQHVQGSSESFCRDNCVRVTCTRKNFHSGKDSCNKHRAKRRKYEHWETMDYSCETLAGSSSHVDLLDLTLGRQKPAELVGDIDDTRKRQSEYTDESTCRRIDLPKLNLTLSLTNSLEKSTMSHLDLTDTLGENEMLVVQGPTSYSELCTHTTTRSALSSAKTGQNLLGSGVDESTFMNYKETESSDALTAQSLLKRTFKKFNYVLSCYDNLQMEANGLQRQTESFDLNATVYEKNMLDASMMVGLQSGNREKSLENVQSIAPANDIAMCKTNETMRVAPLVSVLEESHTNSAMLTFHEELPKCDGALSIQSANKTGQSLLGSSVDESTFIKSKEAECSGVSTPQSSLQQTFENFHNNLSCHEHLEMETIHLQRQPRSFGMNISVDEESMLDAFSTSTLQPGLLESSLEDFESLAPSNDLAICTSDKNLLETPQECISEESPTKSKITTAEERVNCKGTLHIQSADKTEQSLLGSGIEDSIFINYKEAKGSGVSTPRAVLQKTFVKFDYILPHPEHLQVKTKDLQKQTESFKVNVAVDENSMSDASMMPTLESGILEESVESFQSLAPPNDLPTYKKDKIMLEDLEGNINEDSPTDSQTSTFKERKISKAKRKMFMTTEEGYFERDPEKFYEGATVPSIEDGVKMKQNSEEMPLHCKEGEVLPKLAEEAVSKKIQDENMQSEQKSGSTLTSHTHDNDIRVSLQGIGCKLRKKRAIPKASLAESSANVVVCTITGQQQVFQESKANFQTQRWDKDIACDLCHRGPSLLLGEWYSCCCGSQVQDCSCGVVSSKHDNNGDTCSGKVHKMCALWSIKVYNEDASFDGLSNIVARGKFLKCARCQKDGATLSCIAKNCAQVFHYPCADMLASKLRCRMQIEPRYAVACQEHRHDHQLREGGQMIISNLKVALESFPQRQGGTLRRLHYFGSNLLSEDISGGCEALLIPCTNDVDSMPAPRITYTNSTRYLARAKNVFKSLLLKQENFALPCKGCNVVEMDDPHAKMSCHHSPTDGHRYMDARIDWQGQPMFGRLSYDHYGRLQVEPEMDIVECNSRCPCDYACLNRELQKGLRLHLEVFRTETQRWAVRTTEGIARGKFVVEFVGEILTHAEAHRRRGECNMSHLSCFSTLSHPDAFLDDLLVIDWYRMSNVACFMEPSWQGNLRMHRVYSHLKDTRFYRIGLYASRDIERGEKLSYEASNCFSCKHTTIRFPLTTVRRTDRLMEVSE